LCSISYAALRRTNGLRRSSRRLRRTPRAAAVNRERGLNLAINGRDAMKGQGRLTIEVHNASLDDDYYCRTRTWPPASTLRSWCPIPGRDATGGLRPKANS
jgi:hypothetical protein